MLIGLLSDTHIAFSEEVLPPQIYDAFKGVDLILHAGDIWIPSVLDELEKIAPVLAAKGDDDMEEDIGDDNRVAGRQTLFIEGLTLWLTHIKPRNGLINPTEDSYHSRSSNVKSPDIVVFGHTHHAVIERYKDALLVNPGSPTLPGYIPKLGSVSLLTINSGKAEARFVQLE